MDASVGLVCSVICSKKSSHFCSLLGLPKSSVYAVLQHVHHSLQLAVRRFGLVLETAHQKLTLNGYFECAHVCIGTALLYKVFHGSSAVSLSRKHCRRFVRRTQWDVKWPSSWVARDSGKQGYALTSARWLNHRDLWCIFFLDSCHLALATVCCDSGLKNQMEINTFASIRSVDFGNYSSVLSTTSTHKKRYFKLLVFLPLVD